MTPEGPFRKLKPGLYIDVNNAAVLNAPEVLIEMGLKDTQENRHLVYQIFQRLLREALPDAEVYYRPPGDPNWAKLKMEEPNDDKEPTSDTHGG